MSDPGSGIETPLTRWQKFRMVVKVIELRLRFIALMAVTGLVFAYWDTIWNTYEKWTRPPGTRHASASDVEFYCPMHPSVLTDAPGSCPICGMPLSKRAKGAASPLTEGTLARVELAPLRVAQAGIATVAVGYTPLAETLTTVGSVTFDERRLARIASKTKGMARVERLRVNFTGTPVEAGQPLAELYSPELYQAVQELLVAQRSARQRSGARTPLGRSVLGDGTDFVRLAREKLALWGITPAQVDAILARGEANYRVPILSPISGIVVRKPIVEGQYVQEGETMFEVADLDHVWVQAQVYENQFSLVRLGQDVEATVEAYPGETFRGSVAFIDPALDPTTRTVNVRYDLANADHRLRPGMFATVTLRTPVARTPGYLTHHPEAETPRRIRRVTGLTVQEQETCPVTGAKLGTMGEPVGAQVDGGRVWTCCTACPPKLKAAPAKYLARLAPPPRDEVLTVPESAVIDTGTRKVVYVEAEPGVFEAKEVVLGPPSGGVYPVFEGLAPGETLAAAGAFLIDAENRLHPASGVVYAESAPPKRPASTRAAAVPTNSHRH